MNEKNNPNNLELLRPLAKDPKTNVPQLVKLIDYTELRVDLASNPNLPLSYKLTKLLDVPKETHGNIKELVKWHRLYFQILEQIALSPITELYSIGIPQEDISALEEFVMRDTHFFQNYVLLNRKFIEKQNFNLAKAAASYSPILATYYEQMELLETINSRPKTNQ
jgi:hypothetical protein